MKDDGQVLKILMIGTLPPPRWRYQCTSVSLAHLVRALEKRDDVQVTVVNTSGSRPGKGGVVSNQSPASRRAFL